MEQPDPVILTGIGIGTAFGVLVMLLVAILLIRLVSWLIDRRSGNNDMSIEGDALEPEMRNRAQAASIAVTALIQSRPHLSRSERAPEE